MAPDVRQMATYLKNQKQAQKRFSDIIKNLLLKQNHSNSCVWAESIHVSDKEGDEDAAEQGRGRGGEDHHHDAPCQVDQSAEPRTHDDLSQLDHAGERGAVHPGAPLVFSASSQLLLFLDTQGGIRQGRVCVCVHTWCHHRLHDQKHSQQETINIWQTEGALENIMWPSGKYLYLFMTSELSWAAPVMWGWTTSPAHLSQLNQLWCVKSKYFSDDNWFFCIVIIKIGLLLYK